MINKIDLAYAACLIDSEGSIVIRKTKPKKNHWAAYYTLMISICNTHHGVLIDMKKMFGGSICRYDRPDINGYYKWQCYSLQAENCLKKLLPYFRIKKLQAELGLLFRKTKNYNKGRKRVNESLYLFREQVKEAISKLNHLAAAENKHSDIFFNEYEVMFRSLEKSRELARRAAYQN